MIGNGCDFFDTYDEHALDFHLVSDSVCNVSAKLNGVQNSHIDKLSAVCDK